MHFLGRSLTTKPCSINLRVNVLMLPHFTISTGSVRSVKPINLSRVLIKLEYVQPFISDLTVIAQLVNRIVTIFSPLFHCGIIAN
ncbi:hypothetical protein HWD03_gp105 [Alteromonas phage vB_AmeM_PT11-V22]|uniref:Uncharacterized protein n=1 Tax=Alteromonas phage vB_AmeM_PT11-V22 TaxID=2704031 RepID=A0A6C0R325_9CAUD|nr:hypothetical protein HWD03_gp105 [Alteromonas phage vB_AmeM_PT11-V22]QHZ59842.1 hypothetical protein [Alteromonas phage vB_AmeM_PT11-V22]